MKIDLAFSSVSRLARRNRLPTALALCHIRIIASGVGAIVPGLPGVGPRAVAIIGAGAVIAAGRIVTVIPVIGIVPIIPEVEVGIARAPPVRRINPSEPEPAAEMLRATVELGTMKRAPVAVKLTAMEPGNRAGARPTTTMKPPASISGTGGLWLRNNGSKQQRR